MFVSEAASRMKPRLQGGGARSLIPDQDESIHESDDADDTVDRAGDCSDGGLTEPNSAVEHDVERAQRTDGEDERISLGGWEEQSGQEDDHGGDGDDDEDSAILSEYSRRPHRPGSSLGGPRPGLKADLERRKSCVAARRLLVHPRCDRRERTRGLERHCFSRRPIVGGTPVEPLCRSHVRF